jgi:alkyl sulfatase BDS1-like metallo-beta-lactamase superfamily hydrolase
MERRALAKLSILGLVTVGLAYTASAQNQDARKDATDATKQANSALLKQLPFNDNSDFDAANRGFIAALPPEVIKGSEGNVIWDPQKYNFIKELTAPDTVNPSLWRQSRLINISGLFQVTDGIYQVRNQDLSNMTIIEGSEALQSSIR